MIKKLKLIPLGIICLLVVCFLGISLNAQSVSQQDVLSVDVAKLLELNKQEQELLKLPLTDESADALEKINLKKQALQFQIASNKKAAKYSIQKSSPESKAMNVDNSAYDQAAQLNQKLESQGSPYKAVVKTIRGKKYVEYIKRNNNAYHTIKSKK